MGQDQNLTFSEYDLFAYQTKADDACSNILANILPTEAPSTPGMGQKVEPFFLKVVILHIKLKGVGIEHHESKYSVLTHTLYPWGGIKMSNIFLVSERGDLAYQIKVKEV